MFYQTTTLSQDELKDAQEKAQTQEQLVYWLYKSFNNNGMIPSNVWRDLISLHKIPIETPLTSIRRAINTLTEEGKLTKSEEQKKGYFGKPEHVWHLKVTEIVIKQQTLFN